MSKLCLDLLRIPSHKEYLYPNVNKPLRRKNILKNGKIIKSRIFNI